MQGTPACPVCNATQWVSLSTRTYRQDDPGRSDYETVRYEVLFHVWLDDPPQVTLETVACSSCGFSTYVPRPTDDEIRRKYEYINSHPASSLEFGRDLPTDHVRSRELFRISKRFLRGEGAKILDFGGGKGRLLHSFVQAGHRCAVVDYVDCVANGVEYLGSELASLPVDSSFDMIICSHVIEHLANPKSIICALRDRLERDGALYVEVPLEIWKQAPPRLDPVTHINFFTRESLQALLEASGLNVVSCRYRSFVMPNGKIGIAVKAFARARSNPDTSSIHAGIEPVTKLIDPSWFDRLIRLAIHPRLLSNLWK